MAIDQNNTRIIFKVQNTGLNVAFTDGEMLTGAALKNIKNVTKVCSIATAKKVYITTNKGEFEGNYEIITSSLFITCKITNLKAINACEYAAILRGLNGVLKALNQLQ
jgi:hypothetical protein